MADLTDLQNRLGLLFKDQSILELALTHSSYINENPGAAPESNERLEFLGDAVLGLLIAEKLFQQSPPFTEGQMSKLRAALVRRDALVRIARRLKLGECLYLGKGEEASGGRDKPANLAGAFEALLAAVFLDQGLNTTRDVVLMLFGGELESAGKRGAEIDFKSRLQEFVQARQQVTPTYHLIEATGPDHDRIFTVEVKAGEKMLGSGSGKSKKAAENEAALAALRCLSSNFTA